MVSGARCRIAVLGPVLVEARDGSLTEPAGTLAKRLLVALALAPGGAASDARLAEVLWEDAPPRNPKAALQMLVSRLRQVVAEDLLESTPTGYRIDVSATDLGIVRKALPLLSGLTPELVVGRVAELLALWRSDPGADLGESALAAELRDDAAGLLAKLRELRARASLDDDDPLTALDDLQVLAALRPFDETIQALRLRALAALDRRAEALTAFADFRRLLADELGAEPGQALVEAHAALLRDHAGAARVRLGLRHAPTALIGRDEDLVRLADLLADSRLTTILGPGGLGKTRLAQQLAVEDDRPGVVLVELAGVRSGEDIPVAVGSTLGLAEARVARPRNSIPALRERILSALRERPTLLVLDNCEHLIDDVAAWVDDALQAVPDLAVLTTSRAPLAIPGERVYPLAALPADEGGPAGLLFLERATAVRPGATLPADAVARICARLDGLPLAIELAAARVRSMSVDEIERRLADRFGLLTVGTRTAPERHRTLLAVIEWSWNLLGPREQELLPLLAVFPDGFSADGAAFLAERDVAEELDGLVQQSLLQLSEGTDGRLRYRMLETVREFGELQLAESGRRDGAEAALVRWAVDLSVRQCPEIGGRGVVEAAQLVAAEQENLLAVLRDALGRRDARTAYAVFGVLAQLWTIQSAHAQIVTLGPSLLDLEPGYIPDEQVAETALIALAISAGTLLISRSAAALRLLPRLARMAQRAPALSDRLAATVRLALATPRPNELEAELQRQRMAEDPSVAAFAWLTTSQLVENRGQVGEAIEAARIAYDLSGKAGYVWAHAMAAQGLAYLYSQSRRASEAMEWAGIAREELRRFDADGDLAQLDWIVALSLISLDRRDEARIILERLDRIRGEMGLEEADLATIVSVGSAHLAAVEGRFDEALARYADSLGRGEDRQPIIDPWRFMAAAACLAFSADVGYERWGSDDREWLTRLAHRFRMAVLRDLRMRGPGSDLPVVGTAATGYGTWLVARPEASPAEWRVGAELIALGGRLGARQDVPILDLDRMRARLAERAGAEIVAEAEHGVVNLTPEQSAARVGELLAVPPERTAPR